MRRGATHSRGRWRLVPRHSRAPEGPRSSARCGGRSPGKSTRASRDRVPPRRKGSTVRVMPPRRALLPERECEAYDPHWNMGTTHCFRGILQFTSGTGPDKALVASSFDARAPALIASPSPSVPEWRNWQTRRTQNPELRKQRAGSTPASGTSLSMGYSFGTRRASGAPSANCARSVLVLESPALLSPATRRSPSRIAATFATASARSDSLTIAWRR